MAIDRRTFLTVSTAGAAASVAGCAAPVAQPADTGPPPVAKPPTPAAVPHAELEEATLAGLAERMARGETSAAQLVDAYVARIEALDRAGPTLRSVLEVNPDARAIAAELDAERKAKGPRGPLHGIPVLLKDNIDTGDKQLTSAGSLALTAPAPADAFLVERLRAAGAVVLGKANLSEWANIRSITATSGWSGRGGLVRLPYALDRNPSGSSSGSAVAVAASLCAAAVGSETDGSIISPSSICGIVGLKPTLGLISRRGMIPISHSQDTAGPMARTVADAALLLAGLVGADGKDAPTAAQPAGLAEACVKALAPGGLRGKRLGVVRKGTGVREPVLTVFDGALATLRQLGAELVDDVELATPEHNDALNKAELIVLLTELKADLGAYLAARGGSVRSFDDLRAFNQAHAAEELRWFGQELFDQAAEKGGLDGKEYKEALAVCRRVARVEGVDATLKKLRVDAFVQPSGGPAWVSDLVNGDHYTGGNSTFAAVAGTPSLTVPMGALHGLPVGLSFFGPAWGEASLFAMAFDFEQATRARTKPTYPASIATS